MHIVSATLTHLGDAPRAVDALRSAWPIVDWRLVIWTSDPGDGVWGPALEQAARWIRIWRWTGRYDEARNASLDLSARTGADWMVMLDSDEEILCAKPHRLRAYLEDLPDEVQVVAVMAEGGHYARERFFRLPSKYTFAGRTHEAFNVSRGEEQAMAPRELVEWRERPKTAEQLRQKFERDLVLLEEERREHPKDQRWAYYHGCALQSLGRHEEALESFRACAALGGGEGTAFACVRAAQSLLALERWDRAIDACANGVARYPGIGELYGLMAIAHMRSGRVYEAEDAAGVAKALGVGTEAERRRMGFRLTELLGEVPDQILTWARSTRAPAEKGAAAA